eukprot:scaffold626937_cov17-Prasinocladus_malaysianus.AAC.1
MLCSANAAAASIIGCRPTVSVSWRDNNEVSIGTNEENKSDMFLKSQSDNCPCQSQGKKDGIKCCNCGMLDTV